MEQKIVDGIIENIPDNHKKVYQKMQAQADTRKNSSLIESKKEALYLTIRAKELLNQRLLGKIEDSDLAYELATDTKLRVVTNNLVQQVLHPTPIEAVPGRPGKFIDLQAGISTFWAEMQQEIPMKIDNAVAVENIVMSLNSGLDKDIEPDVRKAFLAEAGIPGNKISEFVGIRDEIVYENRVKDTIRLQIMEEMGISSEEISENDELLVESMTEERMFNQKITMEENMTGHEPTYEEIYGCSAQDLYEMFAEDNDGITIPTNGQDISVDDEEWTHIMDMAGAESAYNEMLNASIEDNMAELYDTYMAEQDAGLGFDLDFVSELPEEIVKQ